ncbi:MAG: hypothetical protein GDA55_00525 [Cellvibrionales bacterium]|nr:hypothetical protein [Cellvibrionales bacterium]
MNGYTRYIPHDLSLPRDLQSPHAVMTRIYLVMALVFCLFACGEQKMTKQDLINLADHSIQLCISEYSRFGGKTFGTAPDNYPKSILTHCLN